MAVQKQKLIAEGETFPLPKHTWKYAVTPEEGAYAIMKANGDDLNIYDHEAFSENLTRHSIECVEFEAVDGNVRLVYFT